MAAKWFLALSTRTILAKAFWFGSAIFGTAIAQTALNPPQPGSGPPSNAYIGNQVCAGCHASIYASYQRTPMAHASGPASENLNPASFVHTKSAVHYRIYSDGGKVWLNFERPADDAVKGKRELLYFIGSGNRGRTYLFSVDDFFSNHPSIGTLDGSCGTWLRPTAMSAKFP